MSYATTLDNGIGILSTNDGVVTFGAGCGYLYHYKYEVKLNTWGVGGERVEWMKENCVGKFGWHFVPRPESNPQYDFYENQIAVVTFTHKCDATMFMLVYGDD